MREEMIEKYDAYGEKHVSRRINAKMTNGIIHLISCSVTKNNKVRTLLFNILATNAPCREADLYPKSKSLSFAE